MAESIISDIAVELISKLASFAFNEIGVCWGLGDELEKLKRTVATIEAVLLHAEQQSIDNPQVKHWLGLLSEALYDADDLLDEFSYEALHQQVTGGSKFAKKVRLFFSSSNQFVFGQKMGRKVKALRERLDEIASEKNKFHLEERSGVGRSFVPKARQQTHSSPPQVVIGREHDKEEIVRLLFSSSCDENVSVIPIVGFGGLGKTTLAQLVYNDDRVKNHFELKMWVCVSDDFDLQLLVKNVLESASGHTPQNTQIDLLKNRLHEQINGKRYLLVLDDVWNEDVNKWYSFKDLLVGGARGSKILITTRLRTVAEMSRPISVHELRGLSENESWSLFEQVAFKQGQLPNSSLEAMGREIVAKCCGVPLAIRTIGGVLYFKDQDSEWLLFKDRELSTIDVYKNDILPILKLSYNNLPSVYKHCFAYCSLFPKDFKIHVDELIQLWKAHGYVKTINLNESPRDAGFEYFMDLLRLSFFQDVEKDDFGNIQYCKMHDLMHDLAVSIAGDKFLTSQSRMTSIKNNTQHVSFRAPRDYLLSQHVSFLLKAKKIRTILAIGNLLVRKEKEMDAVFSNLKCLRVLYLCLIENGTLPNSIYKLKHLRCLDLSQSTITKLPDSITKLYNLQVLNLDGCKALMQLPTNMTRLANLTDLDNRGCNELSHVPRGIGKLTQLEKLSEFVVAKDYSISNHVGGLDELHSLNNLRGELEIKNLRYVENAAYEFTEARLSLKQELQKLTLDWGNDEDENNNNSANDVANEEMGMEALCPHPNLKELNVLFYGGENPPSWLPSITNLVFARFENCTRIEWLPSCDQLPHLKGLQICNLTKLQGIEVKSSGGYSPFYPSLRYLALVGCPNLKGFKRLSSFSMDELPCFPCVSHLEISDCPNFTYLPLFRELKTFYSDGDGIKSVMRTNSTSKSKFSTLSQLQHFRVYSMKYSLENALLQYVPSLQHLEFHYCSFRTVFSDEKDDGMQLQSLKVLSCIKFNEMENLVAIPKGLQYVTALQRLVIYSCPSLACIPDWMPKLIALRDLTINGSPQLEERCNNNSAEDWPYISHIPNIQVGWMLIQSNGCYLL